MNQSKTKLFLDYAKQPSTWSGLAALSVLLHSPVPQDVIDLAQSATTFVVGLVALFINENPMP